MDNKDKQALIDGTATIPYKLHILNDDGSIKDTLTEEDIVSTDYEDYRYVDSSSLCIGQFVARKLKGEIKTIDKDLQIEDKEISVEMGVNRNDGSKVYDITIDGKSEQTTTKGNQLIDFSKYDSKSDDTMTLTFENDVLTTTCTANGTYRAFVWNITDLIKANPGKTLYFTFDKYDKSKATSAAVNLQVKIGDTTSYINLVSSDGVSISYAIPEDVSSISTVNFRILPNNSTTAKASTLVITKPMLQFGTEKLDYEEYTGGQPSPSPDYPQDIESVSGVNSLLKNTNVNSGDGNYWAQYSTFDEETRTLTRSTTATTESFIAHRINGLKSNATYTLFLEAKSNGYVKDMDLYCYNTNTQGVKSKTHLSLSTEFKKYSFTFTTDKNVDYSTSMIRMDNNGSTESGTEAILTVKDVTLVEGTYNDYVPYGHWLAATNTEKNLCGITSLTGYQYSNALPYSINANFVITEFDSNNFSYSVASNSYLLGLTNTFKLKPNTDYTLSFTRTDTGISSGRCYIYNVSNDGTYTVSQNCNGTGSLSKTFTTGDNGLIALGIGVGNNSSGGSGTVNNIMIEKGTESTSYEPYQEQSILIDMNKYDDNDNIIGNYELCSTDNTKDELNIDKDGNVSITQNIGEVVLNGSDDENWQVNTEGFTLPSAHWNSLTNNNCIDKSPLLSNYYKNYITWSDLSQQSYGIGIIYSVKNLYIRNTNISTIADFKTWLSTHPVTVKYILAEPQTISLGKYDKIEKIDDTENITIQTNIDTTFTKISYNLINWYNLGNFLITKPTDDDVKDTLTFDSMDYTKKFNKSFDPSGIAFPCTALQLAKYCCEECGVELATNEFLNYDFEIIDNQYTNEDTFRNVMQDIGKLAYSWVRIGWDNKCYIDFNYGEEVDEYNKIDNDNYYDLDLQQKQFGPVNRIVIGMSNVEGENVYIEDEKSIVEHGVTELQIYDNNLTYTPELRNKVIDSAKVLFGLTYTPMTLNTTGHPWLLGKEKVEVTGMNNTIYYTYPWDRTISYSGHIKSKLESKCDTKTETEYKYKGDVETVLKKTRIIVNKQENTITSLTQQTTSIQDDLQQNYYDKTQTNQLIQTSSTGITNTFSEAGGNNIFRNTGLWFEDSSTSYYIYPKSDLYPSNQTFTNGQRAYEFWDGLVLKQYYEKAANLTSLLLQNGYFEQKQQVPNGNYTVSFKYKKLIESATTKVIINNVEYNLTKLQDTEFRTGEQDSDGNYITQPLEVTDGYIFVRFYTNVNNSTIIYDLMVNAGSVKLAYSQNQNETTTDTVNISKGITITSSNTDTIFKANSDGIRTLNKNNEVLSEFTDKGMKNKQIEVTDEATIVKVLWQNVGGQTWLTRL